MFELTLPQFGINKIPQILLSGNCRQLLTLTAIPSPAIRSAICRVPPGELWPARCSCVYLSLLPTPKKKKKEKKAYLCYMLLYHFFLYLCHLFCIFSGQFSGQVDANVAFGSIPQLIYICGKGRNNHAKAESFLTTFIHSNKQTCSSVRDVNVTSNLQGTHQISSVYRLI